MEGQLARHALLWQTNRQLIKNDSTLRPSGLILPLKAEIKKQTSSKKDKNCVYQRGKNVFPGICMGTPCVRVRWTGDLLIADWEDIENE